MTATMAHSMAPTHEPTEWPAEAVQSGLDSRERPTTAMARPLARGLGWFSIGLGMAELMMPRRVTALVGAPQRASTHNVVRLLGARELMHGVGILRGQRPAPWVWTRVAGDAIDLALLGRALSDPESKRRRVGAAMLAVSGTTVADLFDGIQVTGQDEPATATLPMRVTTSITIRRSAEDLYRFWRDFENLPDIMTHLQSVEALDDRTSRWKARAPLAGTVSWDAKLVEDHPTKLLRWDSLPGADIETSGIVRFLHAPADQGTEVHVQLRYAAPAGPLGAAVAKLFGEDPYQQVRDDLRRFKQVMETGQVVRSDGAPRGIDARDQPRQHPAQPLAH